SIVSKPLDDAAQLAAVLWLTGAEEQEDLTNGEPPVLARTAQASRCGPLAGTYDHRNARRVNSPNSGSRMAPVKAMYPKKLGMRTPESSAIAFTMRFGALPM